MSLVSKSFIDGFMGGFTAGSLAGIFIACFAALIVAVVEMMWLLPCAGSFLLGVIAATVFHWWLIGRLLLPQQDRRDD